MLLTLAIALVAFYAPLDEDGLNQKIFYFHVPIALTAYAAARKLRRAPPPGVARRRASRDQHGNTGRVAHEGTREEILRMENFETAYLGV